MRTLSILLVDDDKLLLSDLKNKIDWEAHNFHVLTASNGVQALNTYKKYHPDVVLTDIMMPGMDGLELLSNIKALDSYTCVLLLSSYDDFSFAKKGLQLGAADYVLKNELTPKYLLEKLSEIKAYVKQKYDHQFYTLSNTVKNYFQEEKSIPSDYLKSDSSLQSFFESEHYYIIIEYPVPFFNTTSTKNICNDLLSVPQKSMSNIYFIETASEISDHQVLLSLKLKSEASKLQIETELIALCRVLLQKNKTVCSDLCFIYEKTPQTIHHFYNKYRTLAIKKRWFSRIGTGFNVINISNLHMEERIESFILTADAVMTFIENIDRFQLDMHIPNFLNQLKAAEGFGPSNSFYDAIYNGICKKAATLAIPQPHVPNAYHYPALFDWMFEQLATISSTSPTIGTTLSEPVRAAIHYIWQNHQKPDLSVNEIASFVHLSGSYLCTLFKNETQKKLVSFITETRINNAMILLRDTQLPINKIATQCGYTTSQYFSSAFFKQTGMTPKEYRRQ